MAGGFGQGPFGQTPFGEAPWGRTVRFGLLPAVHRTRDAENGGVLQAYTEGVRQSADDLRRQIRDLPLLRDPHRVPGPERSIPVVLGPQVLRFKAREQYGVDGSVGALRQFVSPSARFSSADRGKYLTVTGSTVSGNNCTVQIASVVDAGTVLTTPALTADAGPLRWMLRDTIEGAADHVVLEVMLGDASQIRPGWVLFDGTAEYEVVARHHFPNRQLAPAAPQPLVEAQGDGASINANRQLIAPTMTLTGADVGRPVVLFGSTYQDNRGKFLVGPVTSPGVFTLLTFDGDPANVLEDSGPLSWALLPWPQVVVRSAKPPLGTVEQQGTDMGVALTLPTVVVTALSGQFVAGRDEGKVLTTIPGTGFLTGVVVTVLSPTSLELAPLPGDTFATASNQVWQLRSRVALADSRTLEARAPSLLPTLAADFGLTVDRQEAADRQRAWVRHVAAWTLLKGTDKGYEVVGRLSGAQVTPTPLFRITTSVAQTVPADRRVEHQEWAVGRAGTDGVLSQAPSGVIRLSSPTATFKPSDEGRLLRVAGSGISGNNRLFTIRTTVNSTTVDLQPEDGTTLPDTSIVRWNIARLYTTEPPRLPRYDDFNTDLMQWLINGDPATRDVWSVDRWCWEDGTVDSLPLTLTAVEALYPGRFRLTVTGRPDVATTVGPWKVIDPSGESFFMETLPQQIDGVPTFTFEVGSLLPPVTGAGLLQYVCPVALGCNYCAASVVLLTIEPELQENPTPQEVERFSERLLQRLEEVRPEHVTLIPRFTGTLEASFDATATIEAHVIGADLYAAFSPHFDQIPADVIPADGGTLVTIEIPP